MSEFFDKSAFDGAATDCRSFTDAAAAVNRIREIYDSGIATMRERFDAFLAGELDTFADPPTYPVRTFLPTITASSLIF